MRIPALSFGKVLVGTAVVLAVTTGTAYAVATVTSSDIVDGTIKSVDIGNGQVKSGDILNGTVTTGDVKNETLTSADILNETLTAADLAANSVGSSEILTDAVGATEIADNSIDGGEIVNFALTNQDVGVLFAQVNADGTLANSSGSVTATRTGAAGTGTYEVDFGRTISSCAFVASLGTSGTAVQIGEVSAVDRTGNAEAVFVETNNSAGASADKAFQLVVVC